MPGAMTLGSDVTGSSFDQALGYVRARIADFRQVGKNDLPALWYQTNKIANAARNAGDSDLAARATAELGKIKAAQDDWERHNDTLNSILGPLNAAGLSLGAIPLAAWVVVATIGVAAAMAAAFVFRDQARVQISALCIEAVRKGQISASDCGKLTPPAPVGFGGTLVGIAALGGLAWFLLRKRGA